MRKNKNKRYAGKLTKRKKNQVTWLIILTLTIIAGLGLKIHGNMVGTEIVLAQNYEQVSINKKTEKDLTIQEHIWGILKDEYYLSTDEIITAMTIIKCESKFDPYAIGVNTNGSKDIGVWQVNEPSHRDKKGYSRACMFDVYCQTRFIMDNIYSESGWNPWTCFN